MHALQQGLTVPHKCLSGGRPIYAVPEGSVQFVVYNSALRCLSGERLKDPMPEGPVFILDSRADPEECSAFSFRRGQMSFWEEQTVQRSKLFQSNAIDI